MGGSDGCWAGSFRPLDTYLLYAGIWIPAVYFSSFLIPRHWTESVVQGPVKERDGYPAAACAIGCLLKYVPVGEVSMGAAI